MKYYYKGKGERETDRQTGRKSDRKTERQREGVRGKEGENGRKQGNMPCTLIIYVK